MKTHRALFGSRQMQQLKLSTTNFYLLLLLLGLIFILFLLPSSEVPGGDYDRYLDVLWANEIIQNGIHANPFPLEASLFSNANGYSFNLSPAIAIAIAHLITGIAVITVKGLPIMGIAFFASLILLARALYKDSQLGILFTILLACFFSPGFGCAGGINRIGLSFLILYYFLYSYFAVAERRGTSFILLEIFFALYLVFTYSSFSISCIFLVSILCLATAIQSKQLAKLQLAVLYSTTCILYYFIIHNLIGGRAVQFYNAIAAFEINLFRFFHPGVWPGELIYLSSYTSLDWFLLVYPYLIYGILIAIAFMSRMGKFYLSRVLTPYDILLGSFLVFWLTITVANAAVEIPSAGLDYITIFRVFAPILAVYTLRSAYSISYYPFPFKENHSPKCLLTKLRSCVVQIKSKPFYLPALTFLVVVMLGIGSFGIFHYKTLEVRTAEGVDPTEISACKWLANQGLKVTSDFHFLSTYVTLNGRAAHHTLPMSKEGIKETYYDVDVTLMKTMGATAFVASNYMQFYYMKHFNGTRTIPNPNLSLQLSQDYNKIYANKAIDIFYLL